MSLIQHPIPQALTSLVCEYLADLTFGDWGEFTCFWDNRSSNPFFGFTSWGQLAQGDDDCPDLLWRKHLKSLNPLESHQLVCEATSAYLCEKQIYSPHISTPSGKELYETVMGFWQWRLIGGVQREYECARDIQRVWRGHNARWKCPVFSFKDTDGEVRPVKKRRTE